MNFERVVTEAEWQTARKELLGAEKEFNRQRDALTTLRRQLPAVKINKDYIFEGPHGATRLPELFLGRDQLIVYHFMFDPAWEEGCKSCSHFIDNIAGSVVHLAARDTSFAVVSRAPYAKIARFKERMGWTFPWLSSFDNDFNYDFQVSLDEARGANRYNYESAATLLKMGKIWPGMNELPGLSVFVRDGETVLHTYSSYQRGLDLFLNTYNLLDVTPLGRHEENARGQSWVRHHDKYPAKEHLQSFREQLQSY